MAIRCSCRMPVQGTIHWPFVMATGEVAGIMILVSMAAIWAHGRSMGSRTTARNVSEDFECASLTLRAGVSPQASAVVHEDNSAGVQAADSISSSEPSRYPEAISTPSPMPEPLPVSLPVPLPEPGRGTGMGTGKDTLEDSSAAASCQSSDSVLEFARDPMEAARLAREEHKLMFVLHVSGNFEESKFT